MIVKLNLRERFNKRREGLMMKILVLKKARKKKVSVLLIEVKLLSRVRLFAARWIVAYQVPPFMEFSRQEC